MKNFTIEGHLTKSGNILISTVGGSAFISSSGNFIRQCSESERSFLASVCPSISLEVNDEWFKWDGKFPEWQPVGRYYTSEDYTRYKSETGSNGGDYAFYQYAEVYAAIVNGEMKLRVVETFGTSAEFDYDELAGGFQTTQTQCIANAPKAHFRTQKIDEVLYLEQISKEISPRDFFLMETTVENINDETGETERTYKPALSEQEKEGAIAMFLEMGFEIKNKSERRGNVEKLERI